MINKRALLVITAASALLTPPPGSASPTDDARIATQAWLASFNAGNLDTVVQLYTPDATIHGTSPSLVTGHEAIRAYLLPALKSATQVKLVNEIKLQTLSADVVLATGCYEFSGTRPDGQKFTVPSRYSFVFVKYEGTWRISHQHSSPAPRPVQLHCAQSHSNAAARRSDKLTACF